MMETNLTTNSDAGNALIAIAHGLNAYVSAGNEWTLAGPGVLRLQRGIIEPAALQVLTSGDVMDSVQNRIILGPTDNERPAISQLRAGLATGFPQIEHLWVADRFNDRPAAAKAFAVAFDHSQTVTLQSNNQSGQLPATAQVTSPFGAYLVELALAAEHRGTMGERAKHRANARELLNAIGVDKVKTELQHLEADGVNVRSFRRWHVRLMTEIEGRAPRGFLDRVRSGARRAGDYLSGGDIDRESARVIERDFGPKQDR